MQTAMSAINTATFTMLERGAEVVRNRLITMDDPTVDSFSPIVSLLNYVDPDLDHDDWIQTILTIHDLSEGSAEGFDLTIEWSNQSAFVRDDEFISATWGYSGDGSY